VATDIQGYTGKLGLMKNFFETLTFFEFFALISFVYLQSAFKDQLLSQNFF